MHEPKEKHVPGNLLKKVLENEKKNWKIERNLAVRKSGKHVLNGRSKVTACIFLGGPYFIHFQNTAVLAIGRFPPKGSPGSSSVEQPRLCVRLV